VWWFISVIPAPGKLRQENLEFEASLGNTAITKKKKEKKTHTHKHT
jgi:hypothetical protein